MTTPSPYRTAQSMDCLPRRQGQKGSIAAPFCFTCHAISAMVVLWTWVAPGASAAIARARIAAGSCLRQGLIPRHRSASLFAGWVAEQSSAFRASWEMRTTDNGRAILRRAFKLVEREMPGKAAWIIRNLRHPHAHWLRIPTGVLLVLGGVFSILPFLGIWMLPLGLLLIAYDVPFLREPVGRFTIWSTRKWIAVRQRLFRRSAGS